MLTGRLGNLCWAWEGVFLRLKIIPHGSHVVRSALITDSPDLDGSRAGSEMQVSHPWDVSA